MVIEVIDKEEHMVDEEKQYSLPYHTLHRKKNETV